MVVKDRNDDDQIVACLQRRGKYQWDMINGIYAHIGQCLVKQSPFGGHNNNMVQNNRHRNLVRE